MTYEEFEKKIKKHGIWSIPLIIIFILNPISQVADFYTKISSFLSQKEYDMKIELLPMEKEYVHVNSVTNYKDPYVSSIGSWYKFRLTNDGEKAYSLINILYNDTQPIESFKNYYVDKSIIYLSGMTHLPMNLKTGESVMIYIFIPFEINQQLGKKLFSLLHMRDDKIDTNVEIYLYGKGVSVPKQVVPLYVNKKLVRTVLVDIQITNWDEYLAPRELHSQYDRSNDILSFDHNMKDGFIYKEKNEILSEIIEPTEHKIDMNTMYKNKITTLPITFEINNHQKFKINLFLDSTGLALASKIL